MATRKTVSMRNYGQFCPIARASEVLADLRPRLKSPRAHLGLRQGQ
jgi:hypothetical protein